MYTITVKPGKSNTSKMVTVFKKNELYFFNYWEAVERVLCANQFLDTHLQHFTAKYNIAPKYNEVQFIEEMQVTA